MFNNQSLRDERPCCGLVRLVFLGDPNLEVTDRGQVLRIKSARLGDKARYQCSVMNAAGKESKDFSLSVHGERSLCTNRFNAHRSSNLVTFDIILCSPSLHQGREHIHGRHSPAGHSGNAGV